MTACPCGTELAYTSCCGLYIDTQNPAPNPEALMRSRYTAFTQVNMDYIERTMKEPALRRFNRQEAKRWAENVEWIKLEVLNHKTEKLRGFVEFIVHFRNDGQRQMLHEVSEFRCDDGKWFYIDGKGPKANASLPASSLGRNEMCSCGSGKKYKKCCGRI